MSLSPSCLLHATVLPATTLRRNLLGLALLSLLASSLRDGGVRAADRPGNDPLDADRASLAERRASSQETLGRAVAAQATIAGDIDLSDFVKKAQRGLDFMQPGSQALVEGHGAVSRLEGQVASTLESILYDSMDDLREELEPDWARARVESWQRQGARATSVRWAIRAGGVDRALESIAVLDPESVVLYDTVLAGFIAEAQEPLEEWEGLETLGAPGAAEGGGGAVQSTASATVNGTYTIKVGGLFGGSVDLKIKVVMTAQVAPYIEASTNDAALRISTNEITTWRANTSGIAPDGSPKAYFGSGGQSAEIYGNSKPFKSSLRLTAASDSFQNGTYSIRGDDGRDFSVSFSVGVQAGPVSGGISITPSDGGPVLLSAPAGQVSEVTIEDRIYTDLVKFAYRGVFPDGGSLTLENFAIRTGSSPGEVGTCSVSIPVGMAYTTTLGTILHVLRGSAGTLTPSVRYLRGDHLQRPTYSLSFSKDVVGVGEEVTAIVTVYNASGHVALQEGSVSLDLGSLAGKLEPTSVTTLPLGKVASYGHRQYAFQLRAIEEARVAVQAAVQGLWESPVPRGVTFEGPVSSTRSLIVLNADASSSYDPIFEVTKGSGKLSRKTGLWSLKTKGLYKPGRPIYEEDLEGLFLEVEGTALFGPGSDTTRKAKLDKKSGEVKKISLKDGSKNKATLDLRKGKLTLTVKSSDGLDLSSAVSLRISLGGSEAFLRSPTELRGKKEDKAVLLPTTGEFTR